jgi:hypothetical protein
MTSIVGYLLFRYLVLSMSQIIELKKFDYRISSRKFVFDFVYLFEISLIKMFTRIIKGNLSELELNSLIFFFIRTPFTS